METKHTKEYAEKMYLRQLDNYKEVGFVDGYMKAIEETAAPDLLDALINLKNAYLNHCDKHSVRLILDIDSLIKKAKEE